MKNRTFRISLIILLLAIITMSIISGTLAKYVETVYGRDAARVAKFEYTATAGETALSTNQASPVSINLFNTVDDAEVYDPAGHNINTEKLVAPGTCGYFNVVTTNLSEVKVAVSYNITESNSGNVPIVYFVKDQSGEVKYYSNAVTTEQTVALGSDVATYIKTATGETLTAASQVTLDGDLSQMSSDLGTQMAATDNSSGVTKTDVVGWFWAFGDSTHNVDSADTTLGKTGTGTNTAAVTTTIGVTFTQMD